MPSRIPFREGTYYHIYNRGADKRTIFEDKNDYERFSLTMLLANSTKPIKFSTDKDRGYLKIKESLDFPLIEISAYCLMPNHFHLIIRTIKSFGVSKFLQKSLTSYTEYFNLKHQRNGRLFQGQTKASLIENEQYLRTAIAYVNKNPLKFLAKNHKTNSQEEIHKILLGYEFSSYYDYTRDSIYKPRPQRLILEKKSLPPDFGSLLNL